MLINKIAFFTFLAIHTYLSECFIKWKLFGSSCQDGWGESLFLAFLPQWNIDEGQSNSIMYEPRESAEKEKEADSPLAMEVTDNLLDIPLPCWSLLDEALSSMASMASLSGGSCRRTVHLSWRDVSGGEEFGLVWSSLSVWLQVLAAGGPSVSPHSDLCLIKTLLTFVGISRPSSDIFTSVASFIVWSFPRSSDTVCSTTGFNPPDWCLTSWSCCSGSFAKFPPEDFSSCDCCLTESAFHLIILY